MNWKTSLTSISTVLMLAGTTAAQSEVAVLQYRPSGHYGITVTHPSISTMLKYRVEIGRTPNPRIKTQDVMKGSLVISIPTAELNQNKAIKKEFKLRLVASGASDIPVIAIRLPYDPNPTQIAELSAEIKRLKQANAALQVELNQCRKPKRTTTGIVRCEFKRGKLGELTNCWPLVPGRGKMDMEMGTLKNDAKVRCTSRFRIVRTGGIERVYMVATFFCQEQGGDHTRFNGVQWREVYRAPRGKRIVEVFGARAHRTFDTGIQHVKRKKQIAPGIPARDVGNLWGWKSFPNGFPAWYWRDLEFHIDNEWKSRSPVGIRGTLEFRVVLEDM